LLDVECWCEAMWNDGTSNLEFRCQIFMIHVDSLMNITFWTQIEQMQNFNILTSLMLKYMHFKLNTCTSFSLFQ
jgi:hypothetical protein